MPDLGINPDWPRQARIGIGEAVFCAGKTPAQIEALVALAKERRTSLLLTRLSPVKHAELVEPIRGLLEFDALSQTAVLDNGLPPPLVGGIGIVCAGSSDMAVATEAQRTLAFHGLASPLIADVGVAGLWRLLDRIAEIAAWRVAIVIAGMEGALFGVVAGLVPGVVIAVPTSVGYGVASGGAVALHAALASCAPGVVTVNIDNGYGAACAAIKMVNGISTSSSGKASSLSS